ncbi:fimbria/pilus periplasmic chaperone [Stenotrophomonas maltophilia]|nr:fimbria/pilus periplasmic chaperone [Stenotrophomonas maltophilia]MBN4962831.1 fimbria/pilus periplasmic chaperone [Stenotrophomonas maltophilia]
MNATRIISMEGATSAPRIKLQNTGKPPSLTQAWIDEGREDVHWKHSACHFLLRPHVSAASRRKA